jgi:hypothetical protein
MRPSLLHPRGERRHSRRQRPRRAPSGEGAREPVVVSSCDPAVERVREAGGPVDHASYSCQCGFLFSAQVSTTVACPHCGADQAW